MGMPSAKTQQTAGNLGRRERTPDGVSVMPGIVPVPPSEMEFEVPVSIRSTADAAALGITRDYDTTNKCLLRRHVEQFYKYAGEGQLLWIILYEKGEITMAGVLDENVNTTLKNFLEQQQSRVPLIAIFQSESTGYVAGIDRTDGFNEIVAAAITSGKALLASQEAKFNYAVLLIEGKDMDSDHTEVRNYRDVATTVNAPRIGLVVDQNPTIAAQDTAFAGYAEVGKLLGVLAGIAVSRNAGRVKSGSIQDSDAGLSSGQKMEDVPITTQDDLYSKGLIFLRKHRGRAGFYYVDDLTLAPVTDTRASLSAQRTIDKACNIVLNVNTEEILDDIETNANGTLPAGVLAYFQSISRQAIEDLMAGEISSVTVTVDPDQNVQATSEIAMEVDIVPRGYNRSIKATVSYKLQIS